MKTETRIFRCDGCGVELNETGRDDSMPREWYALSHRALHFGRPLDEPNPLHFCSGACLLNWTANLCGVSLPKRAVCLKDGKGSMNRIGKGFRENNDNQE